MTAPIETRRVQPQPIAIVRRRARLDELKTVVPEACGTSWNLVKQLGLKGGRNVAVYLDADVSGVINLEVGQEVTAPFASTADLICSATPGGSIVTATHFGAYHRLGETHRALVKWAADNQRTLAGPNWEIYGHWTDDETQLRTDVFYLLVDDTK